MGDAADLAIEAMERGSSWVYDRKEKKTFEVDNMVLVHTSAYDDTTRFEIWGTVGDEEDKESNEDQYESETSSPARNPHNGMYTDGYVLWLERRVKELEEDLW
jgi:hypothetical protein